jgi:ABC-type branched-subunit amino acid transport system permease subunit
MEGGREVDPVPARPDEAQVPKVGVDSWVATHESRTSRNALGTWVERIPPFGFYAAFGFVAALLPALTGNGYIIRVGFDTLIYMLLALGLNIVVGYAGLLDLGYVAFYGFGAYAYAMLASPMFGVHWNTLAIVPVVILASALLGLLVALPSRRLVGDYLAIVTLFFGQLFVTVYNNGNRISILGFTRAYDVTGGPNGITNIDPLHAFGWAANSLQSYYWIALGVFLVALTVVYLVDRSRTGRAWKSLREDPLAAEMMGIPVNRLKLVGFAFGAAIAGLAGVLFAALNTAVFTPDFDIPTLIIIYAMLILGGAGSIGGVIIGAVVVNVSLEVLRTPGHATWIFYVIVLATLLVKLRPWRVLAVVLAGTIGLGFAFHAIMSSVWPRSTRGESAIGGWLGRALDSWNLHPATPLTIANVAFVFLILAILALTMLHGWPRRLAMIPTLYLAAFVWDNRLVVEPSITRLILVGVILIVLMNARPQGLLGTSRVEIV